MGGRQRTFELIPTSLVRSNGPKPPMTSKAAKKAHQLATAGPRISRAEQRRLEAEELARQKKEYERDKSAARAKAAREKKAAKEQVEREVRRKMGLPEASKFVRSSQPTISRFVRNGNKRMWQEIEEASESTVFDQQDVAHLPAKRPAVLDNKSDDDYGGFPTFSQSDLPGPYEKIDSSARTGDKQGVNPVAGHVALQTRPRLDSKPREAERLLAGSDTNGDDFPFDGSKLFSAVDTTQIMFNALEGEARFVKQESLPIPDSVPLKLQATSRPPLQEHDVNMPSLRVQRKGRKPISFAPAAPKLQNPSSTISKLNPKVRSNVPPLSTQAFLEDHLDAFFPSPSQEVREIVEQADELPSKSRMSRELSLTKLVDMDLPIDLICTQDLVLSSQDLIEINTPCPAPLKATSQAVALCLRSPARQHKARFFEEKLRDLVESTIHKSKFLPAQKEQTGPPTVSSWKTKRKLHRTQSVATDYGDAEFNACEHELLALS